jgi:murein L,D-transpeptidase YcbB/YkuD
VHCTADEERILTFPAIREIAMSLRGLLLLALLLVPAGVASAQDGALRIDLNIPENRLRVYEGSRLLRTYPVSVGLPGHDTPTGSFEISRAEWNPWWRPPEREWARGEVDTPPGPNNPMGRVKLFFLPLYFIHGTPDRENIGQAASHGCVRMLNTDVVALARLVHERAAPQVTGAQIDRIFANSRTTRVVPFRDSISLVIRYDPIVVRDDSVHVFPDIYKYNAVHHEAVYQALLAGGYDVRGLDGASVARLVTRAKAARRAFSLPVSEAFGSDLARAATPSR